jgi:SRSO17 transposase
MWESELAGLLELVRPLFYRTESKKHAEQYLRGLLAPIERKNGWTIAEHVGEPEPKALQRFLSLSPWDADVLLRLNREYAMEHLASPGGILVADPTGFAKKGTKSVGTQRQYSGTLGRIDNCQIATFLAYVTPGRDRVLIDRQLYMPKESWLADPARCAAAGVPSDLSFATRPAQVIEMIAAALEASAPFAWFTADEEFGQNPSLRDYLETNQIPYVMAVPKNTQLTDASGAPRQIAELAQRLRPNAWQRRACGIGSKGFRVYDWALIATADPDCQHMIRRSIDDQELAFYRCHNPNHASFGELVHTAGARWPTEECFESSRTEVGLDNSTTTKSAPGTPGTGISPSPCSPTPSSPSQRTRPRKKERKKERRRQQAEQPNQQGKPPDAPTEPETPSPVQRIHRPLIALTLAEIRRLLNLIHRGEHAIARGLRWSTWRRRHQAEARRAHVRRRIRLQTLMI